MEECCGGRQGLSYTIFGIEACHNCPISEYMGGGGNK